MIDAKGRFVKGVRSSPATEFKPGTHWRSRKPFWNREWLAHEYDGKKRSASEIATQFGVTENAILFWLKKHGITTRTMTEVRKVKRWGASGPKNPMFGRRGVLNVNWRGGHSPWRQMIYSRSEWQAAARHVRRRDKVCALCGSNEKTVVHHIDPVSQAPLLIMDIGNMILLCFKCHRKMNRKEYRWRQKLTALVNERERG